MGPQLIMAYHYPQNEEAAEGSEETVRYKASTTRSDRQQYTNSPAICPRRLPMEPRQVSCCAPDVVPDEFLNRRVGALGGYAGRSFDQANILLL